MSGIGNYRATYEGQNPSFETFRQLVDNSLVQDGDLRLSRKGGTTSVEKVNFGGKFRRFFSPKTYLCNTVTTSQQNLEVKSSLVTAVTDYLQSKHVDPKKMEAILEKVRRLVDKDDGTRPLARRTLSWVVQMVDDELDPEMGNAQQGGKGKRWTSKTYNGVAWELVGGDRGMRLSKKQFDSMFKSAIEKAKTKPEANALRLDKMLAYYQKLYETKKNAADLEQFFLGSLDTDTIADKIINHLKKGIVPEHFDATVKHFNGAGILLTQEEAKHIQKYEEDEKTYGSQKLNTLISFAEDEPVADAPGEVAPVQQQAQEPDSEARKAERKAARKFAADLILNADLSDIAFSGLNTDKGERIGRLLMSNPELMNKTLKSVASQMNWEAAKNMRKQKGGAPTEPPPDCDVVQALKEFSPELGKEFLKMAKKIVQAIGPEAVSKSSMGDLTLLAVEKFGAVCDAAQEFDNKIPEVLRELRSDLDTSFSNLVEKCLSNESSSFELRNKDARKRMLSILVQNMGDDALRRVFSRILREKGDVAFENEYAYSRGELVAGLIREMGPLATKLMQGLKLNMDGYEGLEAEEQTVFNALSSVCNDCRPIDKKFIRASIYNILKEQGVQFTNVRILKTLGIGSIAQTMLCEIANGDKAVRNVVIKVFRPSVLQEFKSEAKLIHDTVNKEDSGSSKADVEQLLSTFEGPIDDEVKPSVEVRNALKGLCVYDQPQDNQAPGANVSRVGSERLVFKENVDMKDEEVQKRIIKDISALKTDADIDTYIENNILTDKHCVIMEVAKGEDLSTVIKRIQDDVTKLDYLSEKNSNENNEDYAKRAKVYIDKVKQHRSKLIKISKPLNELYEKFFNGLFTHKLHFFHGDLQGGNIKYDETGDGSLTLIDYGKCYSLNVAESCALINLLQVDLCEGAVDDPEVMLDICARLFTAQRDRAPQGSEEWTKWNQIVKSLEKGQEGRLNLLKEIESNYKYDVEKKSPWAFDLLVSALQDAGFPVPGLLAGFQASYALLCTQTHMLKGLIEVCDSHIRNAIQAPLADFIGKEEETGTLLTDISKISSVGRLYPVVVTTDEGKNKYSFKIDLTDDPDGDGVKKKASDSSWSWEKAFSGLAKKLQNNYDGYGALIKTAQDLVTMLKNEKKRLEDFNSDCVDNPGGFAKKIEKMGAKIGEYLPKFEGKKIHPDWKYEMPANFEFEGIEKNKKFGQTSKAAIDKIDSAIKNLNSLIEMYKDASDEDEVGEPDYSTYPDVQLVDPDPGPPLDDVDDILHDVVPQVFKSSDGYQNYDFEERSQNNYSPASVDQSNIRPVAYYGFHAPKSNPLASHCEELVMKTDRPWLEKALFIFSHGGTTVGESVNSFKAWVGMRERFGVQDNDKISFGGDLRYRISYGDAAILDELYAKLSKQEKSNPFATLDKELKNPLAQPRVGEEPKGKWNEVEGTVDDLINLQVPVSFTKTDSGYLELRPTATRGTYRDSEEMLPYFSLPQGYLKEKWGSSNLENCSFPLQGLVSPLLKFFSGSYRTQEKFEAARAKLPNFSVKEVAWLYYTWLNGNDRGNLAFVNLLNEAEPGQVNVDELDSTFANKMYSYLCYEGTRYGSTKLATVVATDSDGNTPLQNFKSLLDQINELRPASMQISYPNMNEVTWGNYKALLQYKCALQDKDVELFYRKLETAAADSEEFKELLEAWKKERDSGGKVPTLVDLRALDEKLATFYSSSQKLTAEQLEKYDLLYKALVQLSLGKIESPPKSDTLTRKDLAALSVEFKACLRQRWCTSLVGQMGRKDDISKFHSDSFKKDYKEFIETNSEDYLKIAKEEGYIHSGSESDRYKDWLKGDVGGQLATLGDLKKSFDKYCEGKNYKLNPDGSYNRSVGKKEQEVAGNPPEQKPKAPQLNDMDGTIWEHISLNQDVNLEKKSEDYKRDHLRIEKLGLSFDHDKFGVAEQELAQINKDGLLKSYTAVKYGLNEKQGGVNREDVDKACDRLARKQLAEAKRRMRDVLIEQAKDRGDSDYKALLANLDEEVENALLEKINELAEKIVKCTTLPDDNMAAIASLMQTTLKKNSEQLKGAKIDLQKDSWQAEYMTTGFKEIDLKKYPVQALLLEAWNDWSPDEE